jgi:UTP-glucose-1-phosphate uridylyltransferase
MNRDASCIRNGEVRAKVLQIGQTIEKNAVAEKSSAFCIVKMFILRDGLLIVRIGITMDSI